MEPPL